jgi:hypothetical protein
MKERYDAHYEHPRILMSMHIWLCLALELKTTSLDDLTTSFPSNGLILHAVNTNREFPLAVLLGEMPQSVCMGVVSPPLMFCTCPNQSTPLNVLDLQLQSDIALTSSFHWHWY